MNLWYLTNLDVASRWECAGSGFELEPLASAP